MGDSTPLGEQFLDAEPDRLTILFGVEMTQTLLSSETGVWIGPLESEFGLHLARVTDRSAPRQPEFEEVQEQVREAFAEDRRTQRNDEAWELLRERYEVSIDWPAELSVTD